MCPLDWKPATVWRCPMVRGAWRMGSWPSLVLVREPGYFNAGGRPLAAELSETIGDAAAVTDQSDGYAVLSLTGPRAAALLEKGVSLDLHDRVFAPGSAAVTSFAHLGVMLGGSRMKTAIQHTKSPCSAASRAAFGI